MCEMKSGKYPGVTPLTETLLIVFWPASRTLSHQPPMFMGRIEAIPTAATPGVAAQTLLQIEVERCQAGFVIT